MSCLGDSSLQPSAKGCSNTNLSMKKFLQVEMKGLYLIGVLGLLFCTLWHPCQFGLEQCLRLLPIRSPGSKQAKVPSAYRNELFGSFLPSSLLSNPPSSTLGKRAE